MSALTPWHLRKSARQIELQSAVRQLHEAVRDSSEKNRNYFIAWLLVVAFVILTTAGTSDLQLLVQSDGISLPILGMQLPIFGFYAVVPVAIVCVHFNLLQNLDSHAYRLDRWIGALAEPVRREQIPAFIFDHAALERNSAFAWLVRLCSDLTCYWLGPLANAFILMRYSDVQDPFMTSWQLLVVIVNWIIAARARAKLPRSFEIFKQSPETEHSAVLAQPSVVILLLCVWVVGWNWALYWNLSIAHRFMQTIIGDPPRQGTDLFVPRLRVPDNSQIGVVDSQIESRAKLNAISISEQWERYGRGIDLAGRSLMYASLRGADLQKVDLRNARLDGAMLEGAQLQGANLEHSSLAFSHLRSAQLRNANMSWADIKGVDLRQADLSGVDFGFSDLRLSALDGATIRTISLNTASKLQGITLRGALGQGSMLRSALLTGADASNAQLQGSNLDHADLRGVSFKDADLLGASLRLVKMSKRPDWIGEVISLSLDQDKPGDPWEGLNEHRLNELARKNLKAAKERLSTADPALMKAVEEMEKRAASTQRAIVTKLAAYLCSRVSQDIAILLTANRWPGNSYYFSRDFRDDAVAIRQLFYSALLADPWCRSQREKICLVARREMTTTDVAVLDVSLLRADRGPRIRELPADCPK